MSDEHWGKPTRVRPGDMPNANERIAALEAALTRIWVETFNLTVLSTWHAGIGGGIGSIAFDALDGKVDHPDKAAMIAAMEQAATRQQALEAVAQAARALLTTMPGTLERTFAEADLIEALGKVGEVGDASHS